MLGTTTTRVVINEFESQLHSPFQLLVNVFPGRQRMMAQLHGSLPLKWETWIEFSFSDGFALDPVLSAAGCQGHSDFLCLSKVSKNVMENANSF